MLWKSPTTRDMEAEEKIQDLKDLLNSADAIVIGAGSGLSTSAGFAYTGPRFQKYFGDFADRYGFKDMYSGGFYPFDTPEELWAYWSRYIYINRYMNPPKPVYTQLRELMKGKDYFVLTTNVDHCFQKAGFDKHRMFYTQGDYGLWQCSEPCHQDTYDNEETVRKMLTAQGFVIKEDGELVLPPDTKAKMTIPTELIPLCPHCGRPMSMNLRADDTFVEDKGWHVAAERYSDFIRRHSSTKNVYLELGVGYNTPGIIKYRFWQLTYGQKNASYVCLNYGDAAAPREIQNQSICIDGDIAEILKQLLKMRD